MIHFQITEGWFIGGLLAMLFDGAGWLVIIAAIAFMAGGLKWA